MIIKKQKKENAWGERIFQIFFLLLTLVLVGFLIVSNLRINQKREKLSREVESLEKEIQILEEKKSKLETGISQTQKESYWEEKAREQGYVKEGENPVVIKQGEETPEEGSTPAQKFPLNLIEKIKNFFAGLVEWFNATFPR